MCFTFDDAYSSTLTNGLEVLTKLCVPATLYVVPALVGKTSAWDGEAAKPLADWDLLASAEKAGHEIGNHTLDHPHLSRLSEADHAKEWQIAHRILIEQGYDVKSACYPYGDVHPSSAAVLKELGYSCALAVDKWPGSSDRMRRARLVMAYRDGVAKLLYKLYIRPFLP